MHGAPTAPPIIRLMPHQTKTLCRRAQVIGHIHQWPSFHYEVGSRAIFHLAVIDDIADFGTALQRRPDPALTCMRGLHAQSWAKGGLGGSGAQQQRDWTTDCFALAPAHSRRLAESWAKRGVWGTTREGCGDRSRRLALAHLTHMGCWLRFGARVTCAHTSKTAA